VEIQRVFEKGERFSTKGMRLSVLRNSLSRTRVVFVPVRAYPNAVSRNRARRLLRECWRLGKQMLDPGFDVAVVLYPGKDALGIRRAQLDRLLRQSGLIVERQ
jgi:ribonuclease P protein component